MHTDEIINILNSQEYVIYGAGYVASMVYNAFKLKDLLVNFKGFVTTNGDAKTIDGVQIAALEPEIIKDRVVILAVHESLRDEIEKTLIKYSLKKCIWIYPYLFELLLGEPAQKKVLTREVYMANKDNYAIAARYIVLEQYFGLRTNGDDVYLAFMELHCSHETAVNRLSRFKELISNSEKRMLNNPISILGDYKVLDGLHRLTISLYEEIEYIDALIYPRLMQQEDIHGDGTIIGDKEIEKIDNLYKNELIEANKRLTERFLF